MWSEFRLRQSSAVDFSETETQVPPEEAFKHLQSAPYSLLLLGKETPSYLLSDPTLLLRAKGEQTQLLLPDQSWTWQKANPLDILEQLTQSLKNQTESSPLACETESLFGYFAYESAQYIEAHLQFKQSDPYGLPDIQLARFRKINKYIPSPSHPDFPRYRVQTVSLKDLAVFSQPTLTWNPIRQPNWQVTENRPPTYETLDVCPPGVSASDYMNRVTRIRNWIAEGEIYQANSTYRMTRKISTSPYELFLNYYRQNPGEYFAYWNTPKAQILSASPERFLQTSGRRILVTPIKGTAARSSDVNQDNRNRQTLWESEKDHAELNMITDLLRNDLHRVCVPGSVEVISKTKLMSLSNVHHLYSQIEGTLAPSTTSLDIIKACFPSGSITGCPKIRSIELLAKLEPHQRSVYTGSLGFLSFDQIHLNVAIRTAIAQDHHLHFHVGGGVVWDSDPLSEWEETRAKAQTFIRAVEGQPPQQVGFFETLRLEQGHPLHLSQHLDRAQRAWQSYSAHTPFDLPMAVNLVEQSIRDYYKSNAQAFARTCKLRIVFYPHAQAKDQTIQVQIESWNPTHPKSAGLLTHTATVDLQSLPRQIKHLQRKPFTDLRAWAQKNGAFDALLLSGDGFIQETTIANIFFVKGTAQKVTLYTPAQGNILCGTIRDLLLEKGPVPVIEKEIHITELANFDGAFISNSLLHILPIEQIDHHRFPPLSGYLTKVMRGRYGLTFGTARVGRSESQK